jgi:hypothetical protein
VRVGYARGRSMPLLVVLILVAGVQLPTGTAHAGSAVTEWTRQFGPTDRDTVGLAVGADGSVYVTGQTSVQLGTDPLLGEADAFVRKYGPSGSVVWTRQFGSPNHWTYGEDVAVAPDGSVYVVGTATGELDGGGGQVGSDDAVVAKYDAAGNHVWTRQFGTGAADAAYAVAVAEGGGVYIVGRAGGNAFLARYDSAGTESWFESFGTAQNDIAYGVAVGADSSVYVTGSTDGTFLGETNHGGRDAFLRKFDTAQATPDHLWTRQFGSAGSDDARVVVVTSAGIYVAGSAQGGIGGQTHWGQSDAFLRRYDASGNHQWTRQFGTASYDFAYGAAPAPDGGVYVVGSTRDALVDGAHLGQDDAFARRYTPTGHVMWTRQFGTAEPDDARAAAVGPNNTVVVAGSTKGDLVAGAFTGPNDSFVRKFAESPTVGLVDPTQGLWHLRNSVGATTSIYFGNPGDVPFMGDWNCNGIRTPGMYRQSDGFVYLRNSNTQGVANITFFFGNPGDVPIAGDFNGNGCDTVSIYRPSNQTFYIINQLGQDGGGLGAAEFSYVFGNPGDKPFTGDFNGNGVTTVGLHRESTGLVYFRNSHTQGVADNQFFFGDPGDRFVAGDWNGDGTDTPGLFRPSNTTFYFRYTNTQGNADAQFTWGQAGWLPVSGRFGLG